MKNNIKPTAVFGWAWLNQNPIQRDYTPEVTTGGILLAVVLLVGAVAYDQLQEASWNTERQFICDTTGC